MVLVQNWSLFHVYILGNRGQENVFYDILERKKVLLCCKNKKFKKLRKLIEIFPKGLVHGFGSKLAISACFYFLQYRPGKYVLRYCKTKKRLFSL